MRNNNSNWSETHRKTRPSRPIGATCGSSNECVTDRPTDRQTDTASYRGALSHLKMWYGSAYVGKVSSMARLNRKHKLLRLPIPRSGFRSPRRASSQGSGQLCLQLEIYGASIGGRVRSLISVASRWQRVYRRRRRWTRVVSLGELIGRGYRFGSGAYHRLERQKFRL